MTDAAYFYINPTTRIKADMLWNRTRVSDIIPIVLQRKEHKKVWWFTKTIWKNVSDDFFVSPCKLTDPEGLKGVIDQLREKENILLQAEKCLRLIKEQWHVSK